MKDLLKFLKITKPYQFIVAAILSLIEVIFDTYLLIKLSEVINSPSLEGIKIIAIMSIVMVLLSSFSVYIWKMLSKFVFQNMYIEFIKKLSESEFQTYVKYTPADIYSILRSIDSSSGILGTGFRLVKSIITIVVVLLSVKVINKQVIIPTAVIYTIGSVCLVTIFTKWIKIDDNINAAFRKRGRFLDDLINGFKEIIGSNIQKKYYNLLFDENDNIMNLLKRKRNLHTGLEFIVSSSSRISFIVILLLSYDGLKSGILNPATIYTTIMIIERLVNPMIDIADAFSDISVQKAELPKFIQFLDYKNTIKDGSINLDVFEEGIELKDVRFTYDHSSYVLDGINLKIKKGEHVGICGPTGGGKSTILKLIPRFYDVTEGGIYIDGINIKDLTISSLLDKISIVHQDTFIFDDTIYNNIVRVVKKKVTNEEVIEACKKAQIYDFIMSLNDKFDTNVGARGIKLSGGQKQRIALARAFLSNKDIILLDEATSALDNTTERLVQDALDMFKDKTLIIVAHRLTTIEKCDNIVVMAGHKISEQGTHVELVELNGKYAAMLR